VEKKASNNLAVCIICGILTVVGIMASIVSIVAGGKGIWVVNNVTDIVVSALIVYYAFIGYRKPHGNLLKYIILICTVPQFIAVYQFAQLSSPWQAIIAAIEIGLCFYVAGRLHRVKQNMILMSVVFAIRLAASVVGLVKGTMVIGAITPLILWLDICVAYILRYKEHKEAGLQDAPKK